eukprot:757174_1
MMTSTIKMSTGGVCGRDIDLYLVVMPCGARYNAHVRQNHGNPSKKEAILRHFEGEEVASSVEVACGGFNSFVGEKQTIDTHVLVRILAAVIALTIQTFEPAPHGLSWWQKMAGIATLLGSHATDTLHHGGNDGSKACSAARQRC